PSSRSTSPSCSPICSRPSAPPRRNRCRRWPHCDGKTPMSGTQRGITKVSTRRIPRTSMERLLRATINTWPGLIPATRSEEAFRQELIALVVAVPLAFLVSDEAWKRLALIGVVVFVLVVELLNTAIEKLADRVNLAIDPQIGRVKDMGSA